MSKTCLMRLRTKPGFSIHLAVENERFPVELVAGLTCTNLIRKTPTTPICHLNYACKCFGKKKPIEQEFQTKVILQWKVEKFSSLGIRLFFCNNIFSISVLKVVDASNKLYCICKQCCNQKQHE